MNSKDLKISDNINKCMIVILLISSLFTCFYSQTSLDGGGLLEKIAVFVLCAFLLWKLYVYRKEHIVKNMLVNKHGIIVSACCGILLSAFSLLGNMTESGMLDRGTVNIGKIVSFSITRIALFMSICICVFEEISKLRKTEKGSKSKLDILKTFSIRKICILLILCWSPYCIVNFPARFGGGSSNQILQFFGEDTLARSLSAIQYENSYITNHHPVLLTYFYGLFFKIGQYLEITNGMVFLLSCLILLVNAWVMAYCINTIRGRMTDKLFVISLIIVGLYPLYGMYSYTICKDNLYASALLLMSTLVLQVVFDAGSQIKRSIKYALLCISVLIPFLKNQGLLVVVSTLIVLSVFCKKIRKYALMDVGISVFVYLILFSNIVMPLCKIAPGGVQEAFSIPFQQTALYVREYSEELTEEEYEAIDAVLPVETIDEVYDERRADAVKFLYRQTATSDELVSYLKCWIKMFFKHPRVYLKAFVSISDGYYYLKYDDVIFDLGYEGVPEVGGAYTPQWVLEIENIEKNVWENIINFSIGRWLIQPSVVVWILVITCFYSIYSKCSKMILVLMPSVFSACICLLSPWNGVWRYALPVLYAVPLMLWTLGRKD